MRSDFVSEQLAERHAAPNVTLEYYDTGNQPNYGGGSWVRIDNLSSKQRWVKMTHHEEPYGAQAACILNNAGSVYNTYEPGGATDLMDYWIRIGKGYGSEISYAPYMRVTAIDFDSKPYSNRHSPKNVCSIYGEGAWSLLQRYIIPEDVYFNSDIPDMPTGYTIEDMVEYYVSLAGIDWIVESRDSYVNVHQPMKDAIAGMSAFSFIVSILEPYDVALIPRLDNLTMINASTGTGDSKTIVTPGDGQYFPYREGKKRQVLAKPLKVVALNSDESVSGSYADTGWKSTFGYYTWQDDSGLTLNEATLNDIAEAIVSRAKSNQVSGWIRTYLAECQLELYDDITLIDTRGNTSS